MRNVSRPLKTMRFLCSSFQTCDNYFRRWLSKMSKKRPSDDQGKELKKKKLLSVVAKGKLPFLMPGQENFDSLMKEKYFNFAHEPSNCVPESLQEELSWALNILHYHGYFYRDWVKVKGQTVQTPVSRTLVGEPGTTYKYLGLRLFTIPWSFGDRQPENEVELACQGIGKLNEHFKMVSRRLLHEKTKEKEATGSLSMPLVGDESSRRHDRPADENKETPDERKEERGQGPSIDEGTNFNVVLINYMDPSDPDLRLKPEPYYGMGPLAVSWHMDGNLVRGSTVAVYNHTRSDAGDSYDSTDWKVGLKVSWDVNTPGVAVPLRSGESYFMLGNLNDTHQHCVVAGSQSRFSSTHRVADCCKGTLAYIQRRSGEALSNLSKTESGDFELKSFDVDCLELTETVHNEVEFEWLRQFWMQGSRHAAERKSWTPAMEALEADWNKMEHMTKLAVEEANQPGNDKNAAIAKVLLPHLKDRQRMRQECLAKFSPRLLDTMHPDYTPIHRPKWEDDDPTRPLPFDLSDIISEMRLACKRSRKSANGDSDSASSSSDSQE